jgi:hypothetical protein
VSERFNLDRQPEESVTFRAKVDEEGALRMEQPGRWRAWLAARKGKLLDLTVTRRRERRSNAANRYWWGVVVPLAVELLSVGLDLPLPREAVHYKLVEVFGAHVDSLLGPVGVRSSEMTSEQFHQLTSDVREWMLHKFGVVCPTPEDRWEAA